MESPRHTLRIIDESYESKSRFYKMLSIFAILWNHPPLKYQSIHRYPGDPEANHRPRNTDDDGQVLLDPKCPNCVPDSPCPSAWVYSSKLKQCYKRIFDVDFATADRTCRLMNSHLASIHSDEENELLLDLGRAGTTMPEWRLVPLIGGKRVKLSPQRNIHDSRRVPAKTIGIWVDGSPFNYTKWSAGQPDFAANVESCLQLWPDRMAGFGTDTYQLNKWNDYVCDLRYRVAICKQPAKY
ncbi:unnamed protein product, partial [Mesorhabditis belari]|uniref:C-type lectin domain-containing protein n=1 Tax=Mesorhabditis belari TaxID=2138241 RepID=A0AAF3FA35_9BILA